MAATKTMAEIVAASTGSSNSNDKKGDGSDAVNVAGISGIDGKEKGGSSIIKAFPHLTITVYIPTVCVGVLIGKRGYTIDKIQRQAAAESTKAYNVNPPSSRGGSRNGNNNKAKQKKVSPDSVRISVVNYPPPIPTPQQHQQNYENYDNPQYIMVTSDEFQSTTGRGGQQGTSTSAMDMGVPPTYTELDFSNPQWTPIVIRADPIAAIHASKAIHDICCPEYLVDRKRLVYIMDVPVPAIPNANNENDNLRHASIVGKKGNTLIQLSADHQCRIMVPPKHMGHNVIQLEAPLMECCSCLKAMSLKLQADPVEESTSNTTLSSDHAKGVTSSQTKNARNRNKIETAKSNYQITLIVQPLPSQTKLRNIARKTESKILRKKIPKSRQKQKQKQLEEQRKEHQRQQQQTLNEPTEQDDAEVDSEAQEYQDDQEQNNASVEGTTSAKPPPDSWRLTIIATTEKKATKALEMLKVLVSKGYEVLVEEMGTTVNSDTQGGADALPNATGTDSTDPLPSVAVDEAAKTEAPPISTTNNKNGAGRGSRSKKKKKYLYK